MSRSEFLSALSSLPLGELRYHETTDSTNDVALRWALEGAPDMSVVFADEQTAGRGRMGRKWFTPSGSALAFSLILRPDSGEAAQVGLISGLGALALSETLSGLGLQTEIKWPNDVLVHSKKVAGILVESVWLGERVESVVLGIGVNVSVGAVPEATLLNFPATSLESAGVQINRFELLKSILVSLVSWRQNLTESAFVAGWESRLAFKGQQVLVWGAEQEPIQGVVRGLEADGSLKLETEPGKVISIRYGEVHLRPAGL